MEILNYFFKNPINSIEVVVLVLFTFLIFKERDRHKVTIAEIGIVWSIWTLLFIDVGIFSSMNTTKIDNPSTKSKNNIVNYNVVAQFQYHINNLIYRDKPFDGNDLNINVQNLTSEKYYIVLDRSKSFETNHSKTFINKMSLVRNKLIDYLNTNCNTINKSDIKSLNVGDLLFLNTLALLKKNASSGYEVNGLVYWGTTPNGTPNFTPLQDDFNADNSCKSIRSALEILSINQSKKRWESDYSHIMDKIKGNCEGKNGISLILIGDFEHEQIKTLEHLEEQGEDDFFRNLKSLKLVYLPSKNNNLSVSCFKVFDEHFSNKFSSHKYGKVDIQKLVSVDDFMSKIARTYVKNISEDESNEIIFYNDGRESNDLKEHSNFVSSSVTFNCPKEFNKNLYLTLHCENSNIIGNISKEENIKKGVSLIIENATEIEINDIIPEKNKWYLFFPKSQIYETTKAYIDIYSKDEIWKIKIPIIFKAIPPETESVFWIFSLTLFYSLIIIIAFREAIKIYPKLIKLNQWIVSLILLLLLFLYFLSIYKLGLLIQTRYYLLCVFCIITIVLTFFYCFPNTWTSLKKMLLNNI